MGRIFATFITACAVVLGASTASAQSPRFSFGGTGGFGQTWDDEGSIGKGWLVGGYADIRLFSHTDLDLSIDYLTHDRDAGYFQAEGHTTFVSAALRQRFGGDRTNGYLLGGLTIGAHDGTAGFPAYDEVNHYSGTHPGLIFGGGVNIGIGERLEIGPVVRITLMGADSDSDPASVIMTGVRIGWRK